MTGGRGMRRRAGAAALAALVAVAARGGEARGAVPGGAAAQAAQAPPVARVLIVTGLGGAPEYSELFRQQAERFIDALEARTGSAGADMAWLAEREDASPRADGRATLEAVEGALRDMAARSGPGDPALVLLIGHGSGSGDGSRLNLPGPDLSGEALSEMLAGFATQTVAVVVAASASGGFVSAVAGDRRIVATATRSPREREVTHFGAHFVEAYAGDAADADKDKRVSLLEAFNYAAGEVRRHYERDNQMLTEHALLDDDGDGEGALEPSVEGADGAAASRFFLAAAPAAVAEAAASDPRVAELLAEKGRIEDALAALRPRREELGEEAYDEQLEALLVDLALVNRALREAGGGR